MGRIRTNAKQLSSANNNPGSRAEEDVVPKKRRGRPQKILKKQVDDKVAQAQKIDDENSQDQDTTGLHLQHGKRRRNNGDIESVTEENENGTTASSTEESYKSNGYRRNGSRRKSTPRRAAEAVVECY